MIVLVDVLLLLGCAPMLAFAFTAKRTGPEGPVGIHMVTGPLALLQAIALGLAFTQASWAGLGIGRGWLYLTLPGHLVSSTVLPTLVLAARWRSLARLDAIAAAVGCLLVANGDALIPGGLALGITGLALVGLHSGIGYAMLFALWLHIEGNRASAARADVVRQSEFEASQAEWQRGEWAKLPANAELWQLIQFTNAFAPEVKEQCLARIAHLPELEHEMQALLATGWAEHALSYLEQHYPLPFGPLAVPFDAFLIEQSQRWENTLRDDRQAGSWYYNLVRFFSIGERIAADGGDVREGMRQWVARLDGKRGLAELRARAQKLTLP